MTCLAAPTLTRGAEAAPNSSAIGGPVVRSNHLAPLLRGIVLICQPALGVGLDFQGVGLGMVGGRYQLFECIICLGEACRSLGGVTTQGLAFNLNFSCTCALSAHGHRAPGFALCEPRQRLGATRAFVVSKQLYFTPS